MVLYIDKNPEMRERAFSDLSTSVYYTRRKPRQNILSSQCEIWVSKESENRAKITGNKIL